MAFFKSANFAKTLKRYSYLRQGRYVYETFNETIDNSVRVVFYGTRTCCMR